MEQLHAAVARRPVARLTRSVRQRAGLGLAVALLAGVGVLIGGCSSKPEAAPPAAPPPQAFTGPDFLMGTVGSMARLRNYERQYVSGYGLVVFPKGTGTGSSEVPAFLRAWLLNYMSLQGLGSTRMGTENLSPQDFLASHDTAVVSVEGFIPAGAVPGAPFDVVVTALPQTQTTSLAGGTLWTTDLAIDGMNTAMAFSRPLAKADGPIYLDPFDAESDAEDKTDFGLRTGVIVAGGRTIVPQQMQLILNQPSWVRSRAVADRINERFPTEPGERFQTAEAQTDLIIRLNVPRRYALRPQDLMDLVSHLYVQWGKGFEAGKAEELAQVLLTQPDYTPDVVMAWRALGKAATPVLRDYYQHEDLNVRLAALEAGASLDDERATRYLAEVIQHEDPAVRRRVARLLVHLPRSLRGFDSLRVLLEDEDRSVRIAAYESLAAIQDWRVITRYGIHSRDGNLKFLIDQVRSDKPLIYITQSPVPRLVIFSPHLGFDGPMVARMWENHFMLRAADAADRVDVYYLRPQANQGETFKIMPTVATLAYLMGHEATVEDPQEGLGLSFSQVVDVIYHLCQAGHIDAPVEVRTSPMVKWVAEHQQRQDPAGRPESGGAGEAGTPAEAVGLRPDRGGKLAG